MKLTRFMSVVYWLLILTCYVQAQTFLSNGCSLSGGSTNSRLKKLDISKNRFILPTKSDMDTNVTLQAILRSGNDEHRWSTNRAAVIDGYVFFVKPGGAETCNCKATDKSLYDTHIELTTGPLPSETDGSQQVIVEVTPRIRDIKKQKGVDWSTTALKKSVQGQRVRITGWMFWDDEHKNRAENTHPHDADNWRATAWEIHPITDIEILH